MKLIGLIGGMSWESTADYYRIMNTEVKERLGGLHSARCLLYSVDFQEIASLQHENRWDECTNRMIDAARRVQSGGADLLIICTNTMHMMAEEVQEKIAIPLLHIADVTAEKIKQNGLKKVALLGTNFVMEATFYKDRIKERFGIEVIVPEEHARLIVHNTIYDELCRGQIKQGSKREIIKIIESLNTRGAEGVVLGCTELPLLIKQEDSRTPIFNTTEIHALAAVHFALEE
jgi:aspartate racemase